MCAEAQDSKKPRVAVRAIPTRDGGKVWFSVPIIVIHITRVLKIPDLNFFFFFNFNFHLFYPLDKMSLETAICSSFQDTTTHDVSAVRVLMFLQAEC